MTENETAKGKSHKQIKKQMLVRYGRMALMGWFSHEEAHIPKVESKVVIKSSRGMEIGDVVGPYNYKGGNFRCSCEDVDKYYCKKSKEHPLTSGGTFVRFASKADMIEAEHLEASSRDELKCCTKFAKEMNLDMKIIDAEHLFGGERIIIYFSSNGRVDFRELVKKLAREYQTRIEMRQIGSRDEAKLISDVETCGQECCCKRFLKILEPVNMRMAKLQKATLDPSKISGHCGRLKCCLRYEDETYRELKAIMPKRNATVDTPQGQGKVLDSQYMTQLVVVQFPDGKREAFGIEDITKLTREEIDRRAKEAALRFEEKAKQESERRARQGGDRQRRKPAERRDTRPVREKTPEPKEAPKAEGAQDSAEKTGEKPKEQGSQDQKPRRNRNRRRRNNKNRNRNQGENKGNNSENKGAQNNENKGANENDNKSENKNDNKSNDNKGGNGNASEGK
jgi:cell fate regulator YaaT (PSP1 superfamily)